MILSDFISKKEEELKMKYKHVNFISTEDVTLQRNGVASQFNSEETPLIQMGKEVKLHELEERTGRGFNANGSEVRFSVRLPRKRKDEYRSYYFLWEE